MIVEKFFLVFVTKSTQVMRDIPHRNDRSIEPILVVPPVSTTSDLLIGSSPQHQICRKSPNATKGLCNDPLE